MNKSFRVLIICTLVGLFTAMSAGVYAGNKDRSGQAGAQHLLIDPWARSNGWGTAGVAEIRGLEAIHSNVAGMAFTNRTQVGFSRVQYLAGSGAGIAINTFGLSQALFSKDKETGRRPRGRQDGRARRRDRLGGLRVGRVLLSGCAHQTPGIRGRAGAVLGDP